MHLDIEAAIMVLWVTNEREGATCDVRSIFFTTTRSQEQVTVGLGVVVELLQVLGHEFIYVSTMGMLYQTCYVKCMCASERRGEVYCAAFVCSTVSQENYFMSSFGYPILQ